MNHTTRHEITLASNLGTHLKPELEDIVSAELNESAYLLRLDDDYCQNAGSIGHIRIEDLVFDENGIDADELVGEFKISFEESYYSGCRDIDWRLKWTGTASFTLKKITGELRCKLTAQQRPDDYADE